MTKKGGWDNYCPFWDDNAQGYFVGTHFKGGYKTWLYKPVEMELPAARR